MVVSAYHAAEYIKRRLDNLMEQSENPTVIVVCQDGSAEHKIAVDYPVSIINTEDVPTLPAAWNMGIKRSRGLYISNANCDDLLKPGALEIMADLMDAIQAAVLFTDVDRCEPGKKPHTWKRIPDKDGWFEDAYKKLVNRCIVGPMPIWRRDLHKKYGYFDEELKYVADYDWWLRIAENNERYYYHGVSMGIYEARAKSLEHASGDAGRIERREVQRKHESWNKSTKSLINKASK